MGYARAGFEVVGVDHKPQPSYPFTFVQADVIDYLLNEIIEEPHEFEVIHASPPCQKWTAYARRPDHVGEFPDLVSSVRELAEESGAIWVIENVAGAPLRNPVMLCGSSFGLDVRRHRFFESWAPLMAPPCNHAWQTPRFPQATNRRNLRSTVEVGVWRIPLEVQQKAMGIDWMALEELSEAIPPAYTEFIGKQLIDQLERAA
jgi:DNA (cytosine-5)-methyltransferase 1